MLGLVNVGYVRLDYVRLGEFRRYQMFYMTKSRELSKVQTPFLVNM